MERKPSLTVMLRQQSKLVSRDLDQATKHEREDGGRVVKIEADLFECRYVTLQFWREKYTLNPSVALNVMKIRIRWSIEEHAQQRSLSAEASLSCPFLVVSLPQRIVGSLRFAEDKATSASVEKLD